MNDQDFDEVWVEKEPVPQIKSYKTVKPKFLAQGADEDPFANLVSQFATISSKKKDYLDKKKIKEKEVEAIRQARELNPQFKENETFDAPSLSNSKSEFIKPATSVMGDGGASWLRKAFKRAKEQAQETGKPLHIVIAERWGSFEKFKHLLEEAEKREDQLLGIQPSTSNDTSNYYQRNRFNKPHFNRGHRNYSKEDDNSRQNNSDNGKKSWKKPEQDGKSHQKDMTLNDREIIESEVQDETDLNAIANTSTSASGRSKDIDNFYDYINEKLSLDGTKFSLLELNRVGAEYIRYYLKCQLPSTTNPEAHLAQSNWKKLLDRVRERFLKQPPEPYNKKGGNNRNYNNHNKNNNTGGYNNERDNNKPQYAQGYKGAGNNKYGNKHNKQNNKRGNTYINNGEFDQEYDGDSHFDIATGQYVRETKRVKQEIDLNVQKQRDATILNYKQAVSAIEKCYLCFDSPQMTKHTLIAYGEKTYLAIPVIEPLVPFECFIAPMNHITALHDLDDDTWEEIKGYMDKLKRMFDKRNQDLVFLYGCFDVKKFYHTKITCIPISKNKSTQVPMYFKNAIYEAEYEWSDNRKLIDMGTHLNPARVIPKALPYFAFQTTSKTPNTGEKDTLTTTGYAHVIENKADFPYYFGKEVLGGMLDISDTSLWRKPKQLTFEEISKTVLEFTQAWKST